MTQPSWLFHREDTVGGDARQALQAAGGPADFQVGDRVPAEAEVDGAGAGGGVSDRRSGVIVLRAALGGEFDDSADAVAIAAGALQLDFEPVGGFGAGVQPQFGFGVECGYDGVNAAVVIDVTPGGSAVA